MGNNADTDDDGDGVDDVNDAFPLNPFEVRDTDKDGINDNADTDDDNDKKAGRPGRLPPDPSRSNVNDQDNDGWPNGKTPTTPTPKCPVCLLWIQTKMALPTLR